MTGQIVVGLVVATCFCLGIFLGISLENRRRRRDTHRQGVLRRRIQEERAELAEERAALAEQRFRALGHRLEGN